MLEAPSNRCRQRTEFRLWRDYIAKDLPQVAARHARLKKWNEVRSEYRGKTNDLRPKEHNRMS